MKNRARLLGAMASAILMALASSYAPPVAYAAGSKQSGNGNHNSTTPTTNLTLTSETVQWNPKLTSFTCLTEDDYDQRIFTGSLNGSYTTSYQLCGLDTNGLTAGGIGLQSNVSVVGQLSDVAITSPDGSVHHAVLMSQSTAKGSTTYNYAVCYVPLYFISTNTGTYPLAGGVWTITLSGQITSATWVTNAQMAYVGFQQNYCPSSEQNLAP